MHLRCSTPLSFPPSSSFPLAVPRLLIYTAVQHADNSLTYISLGNAILAQILQHAKRSALLYIPREPPSSSFPASLKLCSPIIYRKWEKPLQKAPLPLGAICSLASRVKKSSVKILKWRSVKLRSLPQTATTPIRVRSLMKDLHPCSLEITSSAQIPPPCPLTQGLLRTAGAWLGSKLRPAIS